MKFKKYLSFKYIATLSGLNYTQAAMSFFASMLMAKMLGSDLFGYYTYGIVFHTMLFIIVQFGMDKTLVRDLVQEKEAEKILISATVLKLGFSLLAILLITSWALFWVGMEWKKLLIVLICTLAGSLYGVSPKAWFDYTGQVRKHALYMFLDKLIFFVGALLILFFARTDQIIVHICLVLLLGRLTLVGLEWRYVFQTTRQRFDAALKPIIKSLLFRNSWVWLAAIGNLMMTNMNQFLLESKLGTTQLGQYGLALQLISLILLVQSQVLRLSAPSIAEVTKASDGRRIRRSLRNHSLLTFGLSLAVLVPVYLLTPLFIRYFLGHSFDQAIPIFKVFCLWGLVYGQALICNQYLLSLHLQRYYFYIALSFGILSIFLAYLFIGWFGAVGAVFSLLTAHSGSVLVQLILVLYQIKKNDVTLEKTKGRLLPAEAEVGAA